MNFARVSRFGGLDRMAIGLSGLCLAHCVATAVLLAVLGSVGGMLVHPLVHEVGLVFAMIFGALALGRGVLEHGYALPAWVGSLGLGIMLGALTVPHGTMEMIWTLIGVAIVALGHDLNRRAVL